MINMLDPSKKLDRHFQFYDGNQDYHYTSDFHRIKRSLQKKFYAHVRCSIHKKAGWQDII